MHPPKPLDYQLDELKIRLLETLAAIDRLTRGKELKGSIPCRKERT